MEQIVFQKLALKSQIVEEIFWVCWHLHDNMTGTTHEHNIPLVLIDKHLLFLMSICAIVQRAKTKHRVE